MKRHQKKNSITATEDTLKNKKVKFNIHTGEITAIVKDDTSAAKASKSQPGVQDGTLTLGTKVRVTKPTHAYAGREGAIVQILTLLPGFADRAIPVIGYKISFPVKGTPDRNHEFFLASTDFETISS